MSDINTLPYKEKTARNIIRLNAEDPFPKNQYYAAILTAATQLMGTFPEARYEGAGTNTCWSIEAVDPTGVISRRAFYVREDKDGYCSIHL